MLRRLLTATLTASLLLGSAALSVYPATAAAQQPEPEQMFKRRMGSRIDVVQSRVKKLQRELQGDEEEDPRHRGGYETTNGLSKQLETLDEQCRELERELLRTNFGTTYDIYQLQRQLEYQVRGLESQVLQIRRWMQAADDETESPVETQPEIDTEEDGISDEDWAAEWSKGDR